MAQHDGRTGIDHSAAAGQPPATPSTAFTHRRAASLQTAADAAAARPRPSPFTIGVTDKDGRPIAVDNHGFSDPGAKEARGIDFDVHLAEGAEPTAGEMGLYRDLVRVEHALRELYPETDPANESRFRPYFIRLFFLAQLALEGDSETDPTGKKKSPGRRLSEEASRLELSAIVEELIEDEAPRIKNRHLQQLAGRAWKLALIFVLAYGAFMSVPTPPAQVNAVTLWLGQFGIEPLTAASFMLLWVGTLTGVCLSYAIRTHTFSLADLTKPDSDYLSPLNRLVLAGCFATLLTLVAVVGFGDLTFGSVQLSQIGSSPGVALVVGAIFGIGEQRLPGTVGKRVGDLFASTPT